MGDGQPGEQKAKEIPVHMPNMSHDDETPGVSMNFTQNSFSGKKEDMRSCLGRRNIHWRLGPCTGWESPARSNQKQRESDLPKEYNSKCTNGHESIPTDGYNAIFHIPHVLGVRSLGSKERRESFSSYV